MKATKKIIIGLVAVIALLITIAGALAAPTGSFDPNTNGVTVLKNTSQDFKYTIANNDAAVTLTYTWSVDDQVKNTESANQNYTSVFLFNGNDYTTGPHTFGVTVIGSDLYLQKTWAVTVQDPQPTSVLSITSVKVNGNDYTTGPHTVGVTVIGSDLYLQKTWAVTVQDPQPTSVLSITSVKVNGKSSGKLSLSELNEVEVEVSNDHTKKIKEIVVAVRILDVDGDDLEEESDEFDLSVGKEDEETLEFDLSNENVDEDEYKIEVKVEDEETDGKKFTDLENI